MTVKMILNSYKKIKNHGLQNIYKIKLANLTRKIFALRRSFLKKQLPNQNIDIYQAKNFLPNLKFDINSCKESAHQSAKNCFVILGKVVCFKNEINWHKDIGYNKIVPEWKNSFYQDIKINTNNTTSFDSYHPDIKVPWELSRLQHIPALCITGDIKTFKNHVNSWIDNNHFLIGANWVCPMDVAIRSINLIYGFYLLKDSQKLNVDFTNKLINSLHDHAIYLENNFEIFYKPNNHYIADLIGYFYLCFLFDHIKKFQKAKIKTYKKILEQFELQIQNDGTSYEGSTSYHKLITKMFLHFYYLCKKNNIDLPENFVVKLNKAEQFIKDCTDSAGNFVQIGDNDSGMILDNTVDTTVLRQNELSHYPNFGISFIKYSDWHITYRHPTYNKNQPTGHFHQDALSITLNYNGIPILVDPGSYLYTANKAWRNLMRGYSSHNTFYINDNELEQQDLFLLNKAKQGDTSQITKDFLYNYKFVSSLPAVNKKLLNKIKLRCVVIPAQGRDDKEKNKSFENIKNLFNKKITIKNYATHRNAFHKNIKAFRKLVLDNEKIIINDWWEGGLNRVSNWNFIFHPKISLKQINKNKFEIFYKDKKILFLESDLNLSPKKSYYSSEYGKIEKCAKLFAQKKIDNQKHSTILYPAKT